MITTGRDAMARTPAIYQDFVSWAAMAACIFNQGGWTALNRLHEFGAMVFHGSFTLERKRMIFTVDAGWHPGSRVLPHG
jgi:hypothetical protein